MRRYGPIVAIGLMVIVLILPVVGINSFWQLQIILMASYALVVCGVTLEDAQEFRKPPWYSLERLPFVKPQSLEDLTAVALVRPL